MRSFIDYSKDKEGIFKEKRQKEKGSVIERNDFKSIGGVNSHLRDERGLKSK